MLTLKIITGSTRPGRAADKVIPWITTMPREHGDFDVDALDLRDWPLPMFGETLAASATRAAPCSPCPRSGSGMPRSPKATPTCSSRPAGHDPHRRPYLPRNRAQVPQPGRSRAAAHLQPAAAGRHPDARRPAVPAPAYRDRFDVTAAEHRQVTDKFIAASAGGDLTGLLEVLAPGAWGDIDYGPAAAQPHLVVTGAGRVARHLLHYWGQGATLTFHPLGGQPALLGFHGRKLSGVLVFTMRGEQIQAVHVIADLATLSFLSAQLAALA